MRQIYKDIVIGMILASFTFSPVAFAKPNVRVVNNSKEASKAPLYTDLFKAIKENRKDLRISQFVEASNPMFKKRAMKDIRKMTIPFWDKKVERFTVGKDYVKLKLGGRSLFIRYVDRGPVAFTVNKKPFLWKDALIYSRAKARMTEIVTGKKKAKKFSLIESIMGEVFPEAEAVDTKKGKNAFLCQDSKGRVKVGSDGKSYAGCDCPDGFSIPRNVAKRCKPVPEIKRPLVFIAPPKNNNNRPTSKVDQDRIKKCQARRGIPFLVPNVGYRGCKCASGPNKGKFIDLSKSGDQCGVITSTQKQKTPPKKADPNQGLIGKCKAQKSNGENARPVFDARTKMYRGCKCHGGRLIAPHEELKCDDNGAATGGIKPAPDAAATNGGSWFQRNKGLVAFGLIALLILLLKKKKKKKKASDVNDTPIPGYTPISNPETECPTKRADGTYGRDLVEADLPPECRTSTCADTNSCTSAPTGGAIDGWRY